MVSVLHKDLEYKVDKLLYKKVGVHVAKDQNLIRTSSWEINHPRSVHTKFYSRDWLIQSIIYYWRIIRGGERKGSLIERGAYQRKGSYLRGEMIFRLQCLDFKFPEQGWL